MSQAPQDSKFRHQTEFQGTIIGPIHTGSGDINITNISRIPRTGVFLGYDLAVTSGGLPSLPALTRELSLTTTSAYCHLPECQAGGHCTLQNACTLPFPEVALAYQSVYGRPALINFLQHHFVRITNIPLIYRLLARLQHTTIVTTSMDNFLMRAAQDENIPHRSITDIDAPLPLNQGELEIIHINGIITNPESLRLTPEEQVKSIDPHPQLKEMLRTHIGAGRLFFLGKEFQKPIWQQLYAQMQYEFDSILPRPTVINNQEQLFYGIEVNQIKSTPVDALQKLIIPSKRPEDHDKDLIHPQTPYKFLDAFSQDDQAIFTGREAEIEQIVAKVLGHRSLIVFGASGVGKTSILHAGVMPRLKAEGFELIPLRPALDLDNGIEKVRQKTIHHYDEVNQRWVLIIDQAEEFFLDKSEDGYKKFFHDLEGLLHEHPYTLRILFSIRTEFLGDLENLLADFEISPVNRLRITDLTIAQSRQAIVKPFQYFGFYFTDELIDQLVEELTQENGIRPSQLQIVCQMLYKWSVEQNQPEVTIEDYIGLGGAGEILTGYLDSEIANLGDAQTEILAKGILKSLVTADQKRRVLSIAEIAAQVAYLHSYQEQINTILIQLINIRSIRALENGRIELAHDVMVEQVWKWMDAEDEERLQLADKLQSAFEYGELIQANFLDQLYQQRAILNLTPETAVFILRSSLKTGDREAIKYWIKQIPDKQQRLDTLTEFGREGTDDERGLLIFLFPFVGDDTAVVHPLLSYAIEDQSPEVRHLARHQLSQLSPAAQNEAVQQLLAVYTENDGLQNKRAWETIAGFPAAHQELSTRRRLQSTLTRGRLSGGWVWRRSTATRLRQAAIVTGLFIILLLIGLLNSYYFSTSLFSNVAIFPGHPVIRGLGFNSSVIVTEYTLTDLDDPTEISADSLRGLWLLRTDEGYAYWGEQLFSRLKDAEAGLAYWRVGDEDAALSRLEQGILSNNVDSVKNAAYIGFLHESAFNKIVSLLIKGLEQGDDDVRQAVVEALIILRDTHPNAAAAEFETLTALINNQDENQIGRTIAIAEAAGILGANDQAFTRIALTNLITILNINNNPTVQIGVARALKNVLDHNPDHLNEIVPDIAEFISQTEGEAKQAFIEIMGIPTQLAPDYHLLALDTVTQALEDDNPAVRATAVTSLSQLIREPHPETQPYTAHIVDHAQDTDDQVRLAVVQAFANLPSDLLPRYHAIPELITLATEDNNPNVRETAVAALPNIPPDDITIEIINSLSRAVGDFDPRVQFEAIQSAGSIGLKNKQLASQIEPILWLGLNNNDAYVRQLAAQNLLLLSNLVSGELKPAYQEILITIPSFDPVVKSITEQFIESFAEASPQAAKIMVSGLEPLLSDYQAPDLWYEQGQFLDFFWQLAANQPAALPEIVTMLANFLQEENNAWDVNRVLNHIREQPEENLSLAVKQMFDRLQSSNPDERASAAQILRYLVRDNLQLTEQTGTQLIPILTRDADLNVRAAAASTLGWLGYYFPSTTESSLESLLACVANEQPTVRIACAEGLVEIALSKSPPTNQMLPTLLLALQDHNPKVRQSASLALMHLHSSSPEILEDKAITPLFTQFQVETDRDTQIALARATGAIGGADSEIAEALLAYMDLDMFADDWESQWELFDIGRQMGIHQPTTATLVFDKIMPYLSSEKYETRRSVIWVIRDIGWTDPASAQLALTKLQIALELPYEDTRWDAIGNGIELIVREQPSVAQDAIPLLTAALNSNFQSENPNRDTVKERAQSALVLAYSIVAVDDPNTLYMFFISGNKRERGVAEETFIDLLYKYPDEVAPHIAIIERLKNHSQPHIRQTVAKVMEMELLLDQTRHVINDPITAEQFHEFLEWLPAAGNGNVQDYARQELINAFPTN